MDKLDEENPRCIALDRHTLRVRMPDALRSDTEMGFALGIRFIPRRMRQGVISYQLVSDQIIDDVRWWTIRVTR